MTLHPRPPKAQPVILLPRQLFSFGLINSIILGTHLLALALSLWVSLFPGQEALQGIIGTFAEIIAGLYGVTLTSYIFFLTRIDGLTATDHTLEFVVESLKARFKYIIWYITFDVGLMLLISLILMYFPADEPGFFYRLFCNEFILLLFQSASFILYFGISVIAPNRLEKEAAKLKKKLSDPAAQSGNVARFLLAYGRIEAVCAAMVPEGVLERLHENKGKLFSDTLDLLRGLELLDSQTQAEVYRLHCYYSCVVNCRPMTVSLEMCGLADRVLARLEDTP